MKKNLLYPLTLVVTVVAILCVSGCGGDSKERARLNREAEDMVYEAYLNKDYPRIIELVDSLKPLGNFSEGKACYWLGYAYDRLMQKRMAELYWKTGIAAVENSTEDEDVRVYAGITNRLTGLLSTWTEYEAALKVAIPATERLKSLGRDTTSEYTNMLIYIGCAQSHFGLSEHKTNKTLEEAYNAHLNNIRNHPHAISYRDAIVGVINISYNYMEVSDYRKAMTWLKRMNQLIDGYAKQADARPDYTEKQRAQESDRMKTAFVQHISHEIRTPLNIITGFAQVVSNPDYELSDEDRNRIMADISHNTNEITNFVNELLELSESESQSQYQLDEDVDVAALCRETIEAHEAKNQGRLSLSVSSELPDGYRLKSNAAAIRKILDCLMSNALKFTSNGSVTIRLKTEDEKLEMAVEDTGKGIPRDQQERVFERFYKVDSFVQGIGLGLTVARRTAQLLGGTLTIDPNYTSGCRVVFRS